MPPQKDRRRYCCVKSCRFNSSNAGLSCFKFPKDPERCSIWLKNCDRLDLAKFSPEHLYKNYKICSAHFQGNMFAGRVGDLSRRRLKRDAVPEVIEEIKIRMKSASLQISSDGINNAHCTSDEKKLQGKIHIFQKRLLQRQARNSSMTQSVQDLKTEIYSAKEYSTMEEDIHCFVKTCPNNSIKTMQHGVSFHCIPKKFQSQWLSAIGRDPNTLVTQQRICSEHFEDDDFEEYGFHETLKADVIPTQNLPQSEIMLAVNMDQHEQSEIITIKVERSSSPEEIYDNFFHGEEIDEQPIFSYPLIVKSDSDIAYSDEEVISVSSTSISKDNVEEVIEANLDEEVISGSPNLPLLKETHFSPGTSKNSSIDSLFINPLHYLKRFRQEQGRAKFFRNKYNIVKRTSNRRKKKILYLKSMLNDLKKKIKESTDASKPD